jgi:hypothetical protein
MCDACNDLARRSLEGLMRHSLEELGLYLKSHNGGADMVSIYMREIMGSREKIKAQKELNKKLKLELHKLREIVQIVRIARKIKE